MSDDLVSRLRASLPGIAQEECGGDNLAILLASFFEPGIESDELDDSGTWKQGAIDACDRVLDAIHAHYTQALTGARAEIVSLRAELGETHLVLERTEKSAAREIERLQRDCAEAYKVVDTLAGAHVDLFNDHQVIKALDNLSAAVDFINPRPHDDLLPFAPVLADDPIAALESELSTLRARVREVVGPIADQADKYDPDEGDSHEHAWGRLDLTIGDLRAARQLMEEVK